MPCWVCFSSDLSARLTLRRYGKLAAIKVRALARLGTFGKARKVSNHSTDSSASISTSNSQLFFRHPPPQSSPQSHSGIAIMASRTSSRNCLRVANAATAASPARTFLLLAPHAPISRSLSTLSLPNSVSSAPLDFLLPFQRATRHVSSRFLPRRTFTSTCPYMSATTTLLNPRIDDETGTEMTVEITPRASQRLSQIMTKDSNPDLALRITVESGGCHGFQYLMSLTTLPSNFTVPASKPTDGQATAGDAGPASNTSSNDPNAMPSSVTPSAPSGSESKKESTLSEDDTVFAATDGTEAKVVMDGPSLELLKGSKIDFTMELIGSQFKIVDNPLATSSCGCGTSFDIKG